MQIARSRLASMLPALLLVTLFVPLQGQSPAPAAVQPSLWLNPT